MSLYHGIKLEFPEILDEQFSLQDDGQGVYIKNWTYSNAEKPTNLDELSSIGAIYSKKLKVKSIAYSKIITILPEWKQRNFTARSAELIDKQLQGEELTTDEQTEKDMMKSFWDRIKAVRAYSDSLELQLESDPETDISSGWPE